MFLKARQREILIALDVVLDLITIELPEYANENVPRWSRLKNDFEYSRQVVGFRTVPQVIEPFVGLSDDGPVEAFPDSIQGFL